MGDRPALEVLFAQHGYSDFRRLDPAEIVMAQWVRMKCIFGCGEYGATPFARPTCPRWPGAAVL